MIPLHQPRSLEEACALLDTLDEPMVYAGGTAIQILIKQGVLFAGNLVDISRVPGLDAIDETAEGFRVGPMVSIRRMETDSRVRGRSRLAAEAYGRVANPRVRNTASVGGNIAHGDYRLDPPTALLALDARVGLTSVRGSRTVSAPQVFVGFPLAGKLAPTASAPPAGSLCASAVRITSEPARRISSCSRPTALLAASSERKEFEHTSSASESV